MATTTGVDSRRTTATTTTTTSTHRAFIADANSIKAYPELDGLKVVEVAFADPEGTYNANAPLNQVAGAASLRNVETLKQYKDARVLQLIGGL